MKRNLFAVALLIALCGAVHLLADFNTVTASSIIDAKIGSTISDFTLSDTTGKQHSLASLEGAKGTALIFVSTQCPVSNVYNERMAKLAADYKAKGINVIGINANATESPEKIAAHARENGLSFVILKDTNNKIADQLGANVTPEVFLMDASNKLVYHGRIDNAQKGENITSNDLRDAMDAVIAGNPVAKTEARAFGCSIKRTT